MSLSDTIKKNFPVGIAMPKDAVIYPLAASVRKTVFILSLILALPVNAFAQTERETEVKETFLNDFYSIRLKQISESEYTTKKQQSENLQHKPYEVITDFAEAQKILGDRLKEIEVYEKEQDYRYNAIEITFKDGVKKRLSEYDYYFTAYFPQLEILLFEGGHQSDQPFDLNNSNYAVTITDDFPYHIRIGNPYSHRVSPDKQLRINGFHDGQDCLYRFLEKWNKSTKKYEFVGFLWGTESIWDLCWVFECFWTSNNKVIFSNFSRGKEYYEVTFIENKTAEHPHSIHLGVTNH